MMTLTVFLMTAPPEVTCVSELLTPSIAVFTRGLQAEESSTLRLQTLKTAMPIAAAAHPLIAAPFIHALGAPRIFIGPDGLPPIMLVTYQRTPLPPPPLPPFYPQRFSPFRSRRDRLLEADVIVLTGVSNGSYHRRRVSPFRRVARHPGK